jgi:uncharacterized surface protein with fasciclin (FAS1) repeats
MKKLIMLLLALSIVAAACGSDDTGSEANASETTIAPTTTAEATTTVATEAPMAEMDIVETAAANSDFSTLVAAVQAAGLVDTLEGDGPFTVFAPTNEAFAAALDALGITAEELLADTDTLTQILTYHVLSGQVLAADVLGLDGQSVTTVEGDDVLITIDGDTVMINDAKVTITDILTSNGVIHVIDSVLLPPSA